MNSNTQDFLLVIFYDGREHFVQFQVQDVLVKLKSEVDFREWA